MKKNSLTFPALVLAISWFFAGVANVQAQCSGISLASYSSIQYIFNTYAQQMSGGTAIDGVSLQYSAGTTTCKDWTVRVRAAGNFVNGANTVSPNYFALKFNRVSTGGPSASAIGGSSSAVTLSTSDAVLLGPSAAAFNGYTEQKFDLIIQGGNQLLVPNGSYTTNLIFSLYSSTNQLISTTTTAVTFQINSSVNGYTLVLQNTANTVNMVLNNPALFATGLTVSKVQGLKITGYTPYQVMVKTSSANLVSATGPATIPVAAVDLEVVKFTNTSPGIVCYRKSLSVSDQLMITNPLTDYTMQVVEYNLSYIIAPGDGRLSGQSGDFTTSVIFVAIPR